MNVTNNGDTMSDYPIPFTVSDLCTFGPRQELGIVQEIMLAQLPDFAILVLHVPNPHPDAAGIETRHIYLAPGKNRWSQQNKGFLLTNISTGQTWK